MSRCDFWITGLLKEGAYNEDIGFEGALNCFDYPLIEDGAESQRNRTIAAAAGEPMKAKYSYDEMEAFFREYNQKNAEDMMTAPEGAGYCLAVKKQLTH